MFEFFRKRKRAEEEVTIKLTGSYRLQVQELGLVPNNIKLTWRIENMSSFPVYIKSIGFSASSSGQSYYEIPKAYLNTSSKADKLPLKLDSRLECNNAVEFTLSDGNQMEKARERRYMYVSTSGGTLKFCALPFPDAVFSRPQRVYGK